MQVEEDFTSCVGFLGIPTARGFVAEGTCFFVMLSEENETFVYAVTCRHVIRGFGQQPVWIRVNRSGDALPLEWKTQGGDWIGHPDKRIDICVYPMDPREWQKHGPLGFGVLAISGSHNPILMTEELRKRHGLFLGDEVFIAGLFTGHVGERKNIPLVRVGNIAALPHEPIRGGSPARPAYLVETRSLGGLSGSPVFLHLAPERINGRGNVQGIPLATPGLKRRDYPYLLMGIMQGIHGGSYSVDFTPADDDHASEYVVPSKDADFNAGVGIVLPIDQLMEVFNQDVLKSARENAISDVKKRSGYRPASSGRIAMQTIPPTSDNPQHKEDFTSLLDAATRGNKPTDQT